MKLKQFYYRLRQQYLTTYNLILAVTVVVAIAWIWGSLGMMQRNYKLQKRLDDKERELMIAQLSVDKARLEQRYYQTVEYQELAVRERLNLALPGEHLLILPPNSKEAQQEEKEVIKEVPLSNFQQWVNFLTGVNARKMLKQK